MSVRNSPKKRDWHPNGHLYEQGTAVGQSDVREDAVVFRWWDEIYVVPTFAAGKFMEMRGDNIYAAYKDLKKAEEKDPSIRWYPGQRTSDG